jgi:hypothetical protein
MKKKIVIVLAILIAIAFLLNGCIIQRILETAQDIVRRSDGPDPDFYQEEPSSTIHAEIPKGFPKSVPIYPDMSIDHSNKSTTNGKDFFSVGYITKDKGEKIFGWYRKNMDRWEILTEGINEIEGHEKQYTIMSQDDIFSFTVLIIEDDKGTSVILTVAER